MKYSFCWPLHSQADWNLVVREIPCQDPSSPAAGPKAPYLCCGVLVTTSQQTEGSDQDLCTAQLELTIDQIKAMLLVSKVINSSVRGVRLCLRVRPCV